MVRYRLPLLLVGFLVFASVYPASQRLEFNRSIDAMFEPADETFLAYRDLEQSFGGNSVVMIVYRDREFATAAGLARNQAITNQVENIEGVSGVLSPAILNNAVKKFQPASLLSTEPALFRKNDPVSEGFDTLFAGYTHSQDHTRAAVVAMLFPDHPPETIEQLGEVARNLPNQFSGSGDANPVIVSAAIVGEPVLVHDGFALIQRDGARLATLTIALLSIVVVLSLADMRFVLLTAIMIGWSVVITKGTMVWIGIDLSLVSTILTAIVTVIAVTAVLHLGVRFRIARSRGYSQKLATVRAVAILVLPIIWTCATDAAGFVALYGSRILPIRQFGLMIAIAALAVCLSVVLFAPVSMMLPGLRFGQKFQRLQSLLARRLRRWCLRISDWSIRHPRWCLGIAMAATLLALVGVGRAKTETSFLNNFRPTSPVVQAYEEVETKFGGAGVWDVVLDAPVELTPDYLDRVRALEDDLRTINVGGAKLTKVLSLADAEEIAARAPLSDLVAPSVRLSAMAIVMPVFFDALLTQPNAGKRQLRIMLRSREQLDADQKTALIHAVENKVADHLSRDGWVAALHGADAETTETNHGRVTGYYVLMARLVSQLVGDQWRCFLLSGTLVWLLLAAAAGSIRLATAALIPNLLPILLVLALVGLLGGKINMGAAMIAAVSIGLSIDGCVHFLAGYRRHRGRNHDSQTSAAHAGGNVGVPVLLATIALVVGFGALSTSEFIPTATFGALVAATLALGTAVNLTLLPSIVSWADR